MSVFTGVSCERPPLLPKTSRRKVADGSPGTEAGENLGPASLDDAPAESR